MTESFLFERALLLEDDESHAVLIRRALKDFAAEITSFTTVESALKSLESNRADIIVTDLHLPDSKGLEHVEQLRKRMPDAPVIVLTSSTSLQDAIDAMKLGARDFIVKNFDAGFKDVFRLSISRVFVTVRLEQDRARLRSEMRGLQVAIENGNDGMAVVARDGQITYCNRAFNAFVEMCGGQADNLYHILSAKVAKSAALADSLNKNRESLSEGGVWHTEVTFADDKQLAFDLSLSIVEKEDSNKAPHSPQAVLWVRDISEQKRREKFQRDMISTTTHDLKGPLGAITLSCELLNGLVTDNKKASDLVLRVESLARNSINLIDEFLSARRLQEKTFVLRPDKYVISDVVNESVEDYSTIARARSIELTTEHVDSAVQANFDRLGISRVVGNLLSNALKFTPKGGKVVVRTSSDGEEFHVAITDNGSGMEPSEVQKIFDRFSRLDKHREIEGSGLGLFGVKSIVTAHGGRVDVTSAVGKGTTFDVILPVNPPVDSRGELISLDFK